ncbi:MAG TPA: DUF4147 domain-containing protein [Planctomycetaceae bacterium]|nr:DUF4147 domain-containing protein [Planctomycetaceae bacterium]
MNAALRLRESARSIWQAGVDAVNAERLMHSAVQATADVLTICGREYRLSEIPRIAVVGAGKAGAGMATGLEEILGPQLVDEKVFGWINVPADCVRPLRKIRLHAARPAGVNEPRPEGAHGADEILRIVRNLDSHDLCIVLLSGGGSALLPAPIPSVTLDDILAVTRFLMQSGASINELNAVRTRLSQVKGGGLARAIQCDQVETLIISDVIGDPLDVIASGPTVVSSQPVDPLAILSRFGAAPPQVPQAVFDALAATPAPTTPPRATIRNHIIGNNAVAIAAATKRAEALGFEVRSLGSAQAGDATVAGHELAAHCREIQNQAGKHPVCVLSGGEPTVRLAKTDRPRKGGRNQQLVLAALDDCWQSGLKGLAFLSGGTDGEDGPTDAAGAIADVEVWREAHERGLNPRPFLDINNAYEFFDRCGGLLKTGPTHTNVMDLRVALIAP